MARLTVRLPENLRQKAETLAGRRGVSLNNFIHAMLAAVVAQEEALAFFEDRLRTVDLEALHQRVSAFMAETRPGPEPSPEEVDKAIHGR